MSETQTLEQKAAKAAAATKEQKPRIDRKKQPDVYLRNHIRNLTVAEKIRLSTILTSEVADAKAARKAELEAELAALDGNTNFPD